MDAFMAWVRQLDFSYLIEMAVVACACLLCITFHELCHGLAAFAMGDPTAKRAGRLTLNPLKHVDVVGLILLFTAKFGWAKPVPVNPRYFRNPKAGMVLTALAGPVSNIVLAAVSAALWMIFLHIGVLLDAGWAMGLADFFYYVIHLSVGLAVFNLLPIPPLDGSKVLLALLPQKWYWKLMRYERYGMIVLVVLLLSNVLDGPLGVLRSGLLQMLQPIAAWTDRLLNLLYSWEVS